MEQNYDALHAKRPGRSVLSLTVVAGFFFVRASERTLTDRRDNENAMDLRLIYFVLTLGFLLSARAVLAQPSVVPAPNAMRPAGKSFQLEAGTKIVAGSEAKSVAEMARTLLCPATGFELPIVSNASGSRIVLRLDGRQKGLGSEGYRLETSGGFVEIVAGKRAGLFYGLQTLRQLLPPQIFSAKRVETSWTVASVQIEDAPRFRWRGAHIDVARHFQPIEFLYKFVDLLAMHKLNTMHLHLTEDQGWRIEIKKYPKLTEIGAWRKDSLLVYSPPKYTGQPHGGFYTQEQLKNLVKYAAERFITIVPEIEMPGHAQAAIAAYPELGNTDKKLDVWTMWGVSENVFNVEDSTIRFLQDVLDEVMAIFPSPFIHIGGDECPKSQWKASPKVQARMKSLGLKDEHDMQSWFIRQMDAFLDSKGRRLIGWSEILEGGLAPGAALMVWLGDDGAMTAVKSGHDVVMAQTSHTYFDYYQSRNTKEEPHAIGGYVPLHKVYTYNPVLPKMTKEEASHVLGVQFQLWSEYIPNPRHMEYMMLPRGCALAEVAWTNVEKKDLRGFERRLREHVKRLDAIGVNYRKLD